MFAVDTGHCAHFVRLQAGARDTELVLQESIQLGDQGERGVAADALPVRPARRADTAVDDVLAIPDVRVGHEALPRVRAWHAQFHMALRRLLCESCVNLCPKFNHIIITLSLQVILNGFLNKVLKSSAFARGYLNQQQVAAQLLQVQQQQVHIDDSMRAIIEPSMKQASPPRSSSATPSIGVRSLMSSSPATTRTPLPGTPSQLSLQLFDGPPGAQPHAQPHAQPNSHHSHSQSSSNYSLELAPQAAAARQITHQVIEII